MPRRREQDIRQFARADGCLSRAVDESADTGESFGIEYSVQGRREKGEAKHC
jgi:hypothetical protein